MYSKSLLLLLSCFKFGLIDSSNSIQCGLRFEDFTSNNSGIVGNREEDPASLAAPTKAFPWLVKVVVISPRLELLCGGVV